MARAQALLVVVMCLLLLFVAAQGVTFAQDAKLPDDVKAVWDMTKAYRETTPTQERICINGLWRWQPVKTRTDKVPDDNWGWFKVPGPWPKTRWGRADESQKHYPHQSWKKTDLSRVEFAWYQREITIPKEWAGRRVVVDAQYVHTSAVFYLDGERAGKIRLRGGKVDLTELCKPGKKQLLSALAHYRNSGRDFRGLCGDVYLDSVPMSERIDNVKISTSVRKWRISADTAVSSLKPNRKYILRGEILDDGKVVKTIKSKPFRAGNLKNGRITFSNPWRAKKLWDIHTPGNQYDLKLCLLDASDKVLDEFRKVRFGFREFWMDGRDFRLNGSRIFCFVSRLDGGEVSAYAASYKGACTMISRFKGIGINLAYTHNYSCVPGAHMSFEEIMKAADDKGMLIALSQPRFRDYKWGNVLNAGETNGYAYDAEFYVRQAQNHPSVVMYSTSHNSTGYGQDQNPDHIDGIYTPWPDPKGKQMRVDRRGMLALRAEAIIGRFDKSRPIYHHSSGNLGQAYTLNCYLNFMPIQERSDWLEHWATKGIKPLLLVEYGVPLSYSWSNSRSDRDGRPLLGFSAEWGAQFRGDVAYQLPAEEKKRPNRRFPNSKNIAGVKAIYIAENWPAFRTWGVSMFDDFNMNYWMFMAREGAKNPTLTVNWDNLQKPGFSPDFMGTRHWDIAYQDSDWIPTREAKALLRYNRPLLAYIAGKPGSFTSQDHNFNPGDTVTKQIIVINNSRRTVQADCSWSLATPNVLMTGSKNIRIETGEQKRIPIRFALPKILKAGQYKLSMTTKFNAGETQKDTFAIDVIQKAPKSKVTAKIALFDPKDETKKFLSKMGVRCDSVKADANLADYDVLIIGKHALTLTGPKLDLSRVQTGLKVIMFEQTNAALEKRMGFRTQEYGLRRVFARVSNHPLLAGLSTKNLHDWQGVGTTIPPRLEAPINQHKFFQVQWCGITVPRVWRVGCRGNVASVLIEKPTSGDFFPLVDGGFGLQYSPLMEYRQGKGMILFCQMDVTGRTEADPAATRLVKNMLSYVPSWKPAARRKVLYVGKPAGKAHLESAGLSPREYNGGKLTAETVLVVGPGGAKTLAAHSAAVKKWLAKGGHLLAVGLDEDEANSFLPADCRVTMKKTDYVTAYFGPPGADRLLAGVGPADVYNRDPRKLSLITGGATLLGNGVLATSKNARVTFCQLVPWQFDYKDSYNLRPTFRHTSFVLARLLGNMGVRPDTPLLKNVSTPIAAVLQKDVPNVVWLEGTGVGKELILPKVWKGLPVGTGKPPIGWEKADFNDKDWRDIKVPGVWENQFRDLINLDGLFLYRVKFNVSVEMAKADVTAVLGAIDDEDWTYINGKLIGSITRKTNPKDYYSAPRKYRIPKGLLEAGENVLVVKVNDLRQTGGIKASLLKRRGVGSERWLSGLYLDKPERMDDPYRYYRW